ncbi:hypothetical protein QIU19_01475 [Capnocytophaga canimorsus]|nr:hypothetical protein [Capnocytophaga canimorsus]WGU68678.1 hypothetical protein QIU19_01475 [Capnocytophaga canimorsus]
MKKTIRSTCQMELCYSGVGGNSNFMPIFKQHASGTRNQSEERLFQRNSGGKNNRNKNVCN